MQFREDAIKQPTVKTGQLRVGTAVFEPSEDFLDGHGAKNVAEEDFMDNVSMTSIDPVRFKFEFNGDDTCEKSRKTSLESGR